jgi:magnesium chelatase family protein
VVTIARAAGTATFPASFTLVAARNPCPCGYFDDATHECTCTLSTVRRYQRRVSGPLLDRIDMHVDVPRVDNARLLERVQGEASAPVRTRVERARVVQQERFGRTSMTPARHALRFGVRGPRRVTSCNAQMGAYDVRRYCVSTADAVELLRVGVWKLGLTARSYHRVQKLARTIADLDECPKIGASHIAEALQYRPRDDT